MRRLFLVSLVALALPSAAAGAPLCVQHTLSDYVGLGAEGCSIGAYTVSNFAAATLLPTATAILPDAVTVTPVDGVGLDFSIDESASANELLDLLIRFTLAGPSLVSSRLSLAGATAEGDGNVTAVQDACGGGMFGGGNPTDPCTGAPFTLIVAQDAIGPVSPDQTQFSPQSFFDVFVEITIDGGTSGSAALDGTVSTRFGPATPVPEPSVLLTIAAGLVAVACRRKRRGVTARRAG